ncbi:hypothetical protein HYFRA_00008848 [Hymenoscyphus fraxineus]|uniref:Secreted protein n=1 Tax=Hymenoscyphus fraxineus TaxID=746836 RepID=A0A9N9L2T4_9HELO|nr:hypothetical protein HYFRA_00008848 [Hymenoscyphus fraxineus]
MALILSRLLMRALSNYVNCLCCRPWQQTVCLGHKVIPHTSYHPYRPHKDLQGGPYFRTRTRTVGPSQLGPGLAIDGNSAARQSARLKSDLESRQSSWMCRPTGFSSCGRYWVFAGELLTSNPKQYFEVRRT